MKEKLMLFAAVLLCVVMNAGIIHSQPKIRIKLIQPPPDNLEANHLWKAEITNLMKDDLTIYLEGTAEESKDGMIVTGTTKQFLIKPGTRTYYYRDFEGGSVSWKNNKYKEILLRTGKAPSGTYTICMTAKLPDGSIAGMENCLTHIVNEKANQEIILIQPENGIELNPEEPIVFTWTPPIGAREPCCPFIKIVEITGNQSPEAAIKNNPAFYSNDNLRTSSFSYPVSAPKFAEGKNYAWQITFNDIKSEARKFKWKGRNEKITDIKEKADTTKNGWIRTSDMGFIENKGQFSRTASGEKVLPEHAPLLKASFRNCDFYLTPRGLSYLFFQAKENEKKSHQDEDETTRGNNDDSVVFQYYRTDFNFNGISIKKENIVYEMPDNQGVMNYYYESCPDGVLDVQAYKKVTVKDVYKNVDLVLIGNDTSGMKYEFIVKPGSNPDDIKFEIKGAENTALSENSTKLEVKTHISTLIEGPLKVYYQDNKIKIKAEYKEESKGIYKLKLENLDKNQTIVIDPPVNLLWGTLYGGSGYDGPTCIKSDNNGNIFICGYTGATATIIPTFNPENGAYYSGTINGQPDIFVLKFSNNGKRLWATLFGGSRTEQIPSLSIFNNNVYITGTTNSSNLPIISGYPFNSNGSNDIFLVEFDNSGHEIQGTFYGGSTNEFSRSISINSGGIIFITGYTNSSDFPHPISDLYFTNQSHHGGSDAFLVAFNASFQPIWSTYLGGGYSDFGMSVNLDNTGNIFVAGYTNSNDFADITPTGSYSQPFHTQFVGGLPGYELFIMKFNTTGNIEWKSNLGGSNNEVIATYNGLSIDNNNNVIISGRSLSNDYPVSGCSEGQSFNNKNDCVVTKFTNTGQMLWSRYLSGSEDDYCYNLASDINGNIFLTGATMSNNFPESNSSGSAFYYSSLSGSRDAFLTELNSSGNIEYSTFFGSASTTFGYNEWGASLCFDNNSNMFITGEVVGQPPSNFFTDPDPGNTYMQTSYVSLDDMFIIKLGMNTPPIQTSNCDPIFSENYSDPLSWNTVAIANDPNAVSSDPPHWNNCPNVSNPVTGNRVRVEGGVCKFVSAIDGGCDYRVSKPLGVNLDNSWKAEFEFQYSGVGVSNRVGQAIFAVTAGGDNNPMNDSKNHGNFFCYYSDMDAIMVWLWYPTNQYYINKGETPPPVEGRTFGIVPWVKDGNGISGAIPNYNLWTPPTNIISVDQNTPLALNTKYYCRLERLNSTKCRLSVFKDAARTQHAFNSPQCFDIPGTINGLNTLQHATTPYGDKTRELSAEIGNTKFYNMDEVPNSSDCNVQTTCGSSSQNTCPDLNVIIPSVTTCDNKPVTFKAYLVTGNGISANVPFHNEPDSLFPKPPKFEPAPNQLSLSPGKYIIITENALRDGYNWGRKFDACYYYKLNGNIALNEFGLNSLIESNVSGYLLPNYPVTGTSNISNYFTNYCYEVDLTSSTVFNIHNRYSQLPIGFNWGCWYCLQVPPPPADYYDGWPVPGYFVTGRNQTDNLTFTAYKICNSEATYSWNSSNNNNPQITIDPNDQSKVTFTPNGCLPGIYDYSVTVSVNGQQIVKNFSVKYDSDCLPNSID